MKWIIETSKRDTKLPQIIRAAVKLFVEQGIDATTTKQIAAAAEVGEGTIYRHFKSKEELATTVFLTHLEAFSREMQTAAERATGTKDKLRAIIFCFFTFFETERTLFDYIFAMEHRELKNYPITLKQPLHVVQDILDEGIRAREIPEQNTTLSSAYIIGIVHRVSIFRIYGRIEDSLVHRVDEIADACWKVVH